jgi:hypothetical protein
VIRAAWDATFATGGGERAQRVMEGEALVRDAAGISFLARDPWGCYWPVQLLNHFALRPEFDLIFVHYAIWILPQSA